MQTVAQLYAQCRLLTTPKVQDASITLIENWRQHCGVLLSTSCLQNSWSPTLHLENVVWLRFNRKGLNARRLRSVSLVAWENLFAAIEPEAGSFLPNLSEIPFRTAFLTAQDFELQCAHLERGESSALFRFIQLQFGALPGFRFADNWLTTPERYALVVPPEPLAVTAAA